MMHGQNLFKFVQVPYKVKMNALYGDTSDHRSVSTSIHIWLSVSN